MSAPSVKPNTSPEVARPPSKTVPNNRLDATFDAASKAALVRPELNVRNDVPAARIEAVATPREKVAAPAESSLPNHAPTNTQHSTENQTELAAAGASSAVLPESSSLRSSESSVSDSNDLATLGEQWQAIVNQLGLKAYARQLPYQSELIELSATRLVLRCEKASLATDDNALKVLRQNLDDYFSARHQPTPTLRVHIAESGQVRFSPQKLALQEREAHLAQARAAITQHPTIQQIVHEFDGMILPNSIMPE